MQCWLLSQGWRMHSLSYWIVIRTGGFVVHALCERLLRRHSWELLPILSYSLFCKHNWISVMFEVSHRMGVVAKVGWSGVLRTLRGRRILKHLLEGVYILLGRVVLTGWIDRVLKCVSKKLLPLFVPKMLTVPGYS